MKAFLFTLLAVCVIVVVSTFIGIDPVAWVACTALWIAIRSEFSSEQS